MIIDESLPKTITFGLLGIPRIMQNVNTIITTPEGTVPLDRDFGISFAFLDSPINTTQAKAEQNIFMKLKKYEPRAALKQIVWEADSISGQISPKVKVEVNPDVV